MKDDDALTQSDAEPEPDDWLYNASECAREVLNYLGEGSSASMEPAMDRRRDNIAKIINRYLDKPAALAQSDAEPVACLREAIKSALHCIPPGDAYTILARAIGADDLIGSYPVPPRPDASAGLIEAAGMAEEHANKYCYDSQAEQRLLRSFAQLLRARAAAQPRPDASAGLIEAETVIKAMVEACEDQDADGVIAIARTYFDRTADRSEK
jgi:hypothetical protein